jgi:predicted nucleic acid-binding protein
MMLFVDSSALVKRYVDEPGRDLVLAAMDEADGWFASAIARTEALLILNRLAANPRQAERLGRALRADWDAFHVVPVDERCLHTAETIGANFGLRLAHAIQLAAADRLPRPLRFLTLDDRQVAAAVALDLEVVASEA